MGNITFSQSGKTVTQTVKTNAFTTQSAYKIEVDKMPVSTESAMVDTVKMITDAQPDFNQGGHDVGLEANKGAAQGIEDGKASVLDAIGKWANDIVQWARDALGIHSPSTVFAELGNFSAQGFSEGLKDGIKNISIPDIFANITPESHFISGSAPSYTDDHSSSIIIENVQINDEVDMDLFGQYLAATIENRVY